MSAAIYKALAERNIDRPLLEKVLKGDNWGALVNAAPVLGVLSVVLQEWPDDEDDATVVIDGRKIYAYRKGDETFLSDYPPDAAKNGVLVGTYVDANDMIQWNFPVNITDGWELE